jgi:hypothetical protein
MSVVITCVSGDTKSQQGTLLADGAAVDLTGHTLALHWTVGGTSDVTALTVLDAAAGRWELASPGTLFPVGSGTGRIRATAPGGTKESFPLAAPLRIICKAVTG